MAATMIGRPRIVKQARSGLRIAQHAASLGDVHDRDFVVRYCKFIVRELPGRGESCRAGAPFPHSFAVQYLQNRAVTGRSCFYDPVFMRVG